MERTKLREAREARDHLSQQGLANVIGCSREAVNAWEQGRATPQDHWIRELCRFFGKDPASLGLPAITQTREEQLAMLQKYLEQLNLDRRELLKILEGLSAFAGVDLSVLLAPNVTPDVFLSQSHAGIKACWHLMKHDGLVHVGNILKACVPKLSDLAAQPSDIQGMAASLAVEAKTLQALLAMHDLDYTGLEISLAGAVRFGRLSRNRQLLAVSLTNQGSAYTYHLPSATKAIPISNEGLANLDSDAHLNKARLFIDLAFAHVLDGKEDMAIEMIKQARTAMPEHPELDSLCHLIDFGVSDLDRIEGRVYLYLAETVHSQDYAEKAYKAFAQGTSKQATSSRSWSQTLIHQADAALALGDFREFAACLEQGLLIALQIDSKKRKSEARTVLGKAPDAWQKEDAYQKIVKMF